MDFEKIAMEFAKNGNVQNIHFNDIHDNENVYVGVDKPKHTAADGLKRLILDEKERQQVEEAIQLCKDNTQLRTAIQKIYEAEILKIEDLNSKNFREAIHPLLCYQVEDDTLRKAIYSALK